MTKYIKENFKSQYWGMEGKGIIPSSNIGFHLNLY